MSRYRYLGQWKKNLTFKVDQKYGFFTGFIIIVISCAKWMIRSLLLIFKINDIRASDRLY